MVTLGEDGVYTRTGAFNLVKDLLKIPRKGALINREFFSCFFRRIDGGKFVIIKGEEELRKDFEENNIPELNREYFQKKRNNPQEATRLFCRVMRIAKEKICNSNMQQKKFDGLDVPYSC